MFKWNLKKDYREVRRGPVDETWESRWDVQNSFTQNNVYDE